MIKQIVLCLLKCVSTSIIKETTAVSCCQSATSHLFFSVIFLGNHGQFNSNKITLGCELKIFFPFP